MFFIIGPCALESLEQLHPLVDLCRRHSISYFRAQLFKPRTHPESFQGLGASGLHLITYLQQQGLKLVTEAASLEQLNIIKNFASIVQIGARNMQNFEFLKQIGRQIDFHSNPAHSPFVMLKRGMANTEEEWLASARYLELSGVPSEKIILCERGTRNFLANSGVILDLGLAYRVKNHTSYKVIIDPSHGTRDRELVLPMVKAAIALNFDGIMVEVHPFPQESWSDSMQTLFPEQLEQFLSKNDSSNSQGSEFNLWKPIPSRPTTSSSEVSLHPPGNS